MTRPFICSGTLLPAAYVRPSEVTTAFQSVLGESFTSVHSSREVRSSISLTQLWNSCGAAANRRASRPSKREKSAPGHVAERRDSCAREGGVAVELQPAMAIFMEPLILV